MFIDKKYRSVLTAIIFLLVIDAIIWSLIVFPRNHGADLQLYFLDVGQGDSALVVLPPALPSGNSVKILIDGGPPNQKALQALAEIFSPNENYIDLMIMSHPQLDHFGGFIDIIKKYKIGALIGNGRTNSIPAYQDLEKFLTAYQIPYIVLKEGDSIQYRDAGFAVLGPNERNLQSKELNDTMIVLKLIYGKLNVLYTGDIGANVESELIKKYDVSAQILKVGHHGSKFSSSANFLAQVRPAISIIEVGAKNLYGHPTREALGRLTAAGAQIFRTDRQGTIKVVNHNDNLKVFTAK